MVLFEPGSKPRLKAILLKHAGCGYWLTLWALHVKLNHIYWMKTFVMEQGKCSHITVPVLFVHTCRKFSLD